LTALFNGLLSLLFAFVMPSFLAARACFPGSNACPPDLHIHGTMPSSEDSDTVATCSPPPSHLPVLSYSDSLLCTPTRSERSHIGTYPHDLPSFSLFSSDVSSRPFRQNVVPPFLFPAPEVSSHPHPTFQFLALNWSFRTITHRRLPTVGPFFLPTYGQDPALCAVFRDLPPCDTPPP